MDFIDRSVLILKPKDPFFSWIKKLPDTGDVTLEGLRREAIAVLIPDFDGYDEVEELLETKAGELFEVQLSDWSADKKAWPPKRDFKTFLEWFDIEYHGSVVEIDED